MGMVGADWYVKLSYGPRWVIYLFGTGGLAFLLLLINYFLNHFRRTERDTRRDQIGDAESDRNPLLSHKDDNLSSSGSSYASVSEDDEHDAQGGAVQSGKPVKDDEDSRRLCAICFDAPKDGFSSSMRALRGLSLLCCHGHREVKLLMSKHPASFGCSIWLN
ncbi:UNVERIFIED_CONTAM: E3 ubiquitin-protein ligase APD1 [Sesamum latifolium]|uniref:E3 ubiquitin-protein ligase APD1 n=1 Tax=Sesamum latifolium TaxID=2727402 RepID=A0AAW2UJU7_9LAMI